MRTKYSRKNALIHTETASYQCVIQCCVFLVGSTLFEEKDTQERKEERKKEKKEKRKEERKKKERKIEKKQIANNNTVDSNGLSIRLCKMSDAQGMKGINAFSGDATVKMTLVCFSKGVYSKRKEFSPSWEQIVPF